MKLPEMVKVNEFFSIERMKNKNLLTLLFTVVLCTAVSVFAEEDQNEATASSKKLQHSSIESSQSDLPKVLQVFQFRQTVTDRATEKISESVIETSPVTPNINDEDHSVPSELMEDINQNVTTEASILPKRHAVTSMPEEISETEFTFEQSYLAPMTLAQLENYSCMEEASTFGHKEATGVLIHEVICEFRKLWHYMMIAVQNLKTELQLELPIETEEAIIILSDFLMSGTIFDGIEQGIVHLEVFLENPENLNVLLDTIEKCVPMSHIHETVSRLRIALSNFFVHMQGFVIYLEPHETIHNYIELFKAFEEKICAVIEKILGLFNVHLEAEMKLLLEFSSSVKSLLTKLSFEKSFEENLKIIKEFVDILSETYKEFHASESSEPIISKLHTVISTFISTFLPQNFNIPIVHFVLPNQSIATLSCLWQVTNETSSTSAIISSHHNVTSISKIDIISSVFETEAKFFSELFSCVKSLFEKLCSEQTFEQHLKILKDCIDKLEAICKEYYELDCSKSIIGKMQSLISSFVSTLFTKDFELPILHFNSSDGSTAIFKCIWKVTSETSSISPLFSSKFNLTSIVKDIKMTETKSLPENIEELTVSSESSVSIQNTENLAAISPNKPESPLAVDSASESVSSLAETSVSSPVHKDASPKLSAAITQSSVSISELQIPNHRSSNVIIPATSAVNTIKLPTNYSPIEASQSKTIESPQEDSTKYSIQSESSSLAVNNNPSPAPKVQMNAESVSLSAASLPSVDKKPQEDSSQPASSMKASIVTGSIISNSSPPTETSIPNEQQPLVSPSSGKTEDISDNDSPIPSSFSEKPADFLDYIPPTPSSPLTKPADLLANNPLTLSSSVEETADLVPSNTPTSISSLGKQDDPLVNNPPIPSSSPVNPADLSNINPSAPSFPLEKPADLSSNNPPILSPPVEKPAELSVNNPPIFSSSVKPAVLPSGNPSMPSSPLGEPTNLSDNPPVFSPPVKLTDLSRTPIPPYPFGRQVAFSENNPPISSFPYGRPVDLPANNPPMFLSSPGRPTDFSVNNPLVPRYYSGKPVDYSNSPVLLPPGRSSPSVLFLNEQDTAVEKNYNEPFSPLTPPGYLIPASDIVPNLPRYQPLSDSYANYLESADTFYKSLYSYLQYGNPAVAPPPNVSNKISEFLRRGFPPSVPMTMDNSNLCGTSAFLPSLSALNNILKKDIRSSQVPLYLPRKEIASALGNTLLSPGDLIVILPRNGVGLIGRIVDNVSPIHFKAYEVKTDFTNPQDGIKIWHLRSGDFRNPECEQQFEFLFKH